MPTTYNNIQVIENMYDKTHRVQSSSLAAHETGVQNCSRSPWRISTLTNTLLHLPRKHHVTLRHWMTTKVVSASKDGLITNPRFTDDIVVNAEEKEEAGVLVDQHHTVQTRLVLTRQKCDNKPKWLLKRDQDKRSEAISSGELQATGINNLNPRFFPGILDKNFKQLGSIISILDSFQEF